MRFAIPSKKVLEEELYIADRLKNSIVCGFTEKTKNVDNEQYCSHYFEGADHRKLYNSKERYNSDIDNKLKGVE